ncbi:hypothetical protein RJ640_020082 [Escallonia rubra]|uniref:Uncharacterized protein n=1 Tax=Escallonia rubra TaxID=112253 RepID=A0AA88UCR9_9ASTE|nr:hypothetical protein RJ640_020082 [Escallonia rubra]
MFQSSTTRSNALEMLCGIYQKLENTEFKYVTLVELKSMLGVVQDLESTRLEVWWLHERLDEVCKALWLSRGYPNLKMALASNYQEIEIKKKELDINGQAKMEKVSLQQKQVSTKRERARVINVNSGQHLRSTLSHFLILHSTCVLFIYKTSSY